MILQYFSHEDPVNPGLYASWACLIQYDMTTGLPYATKEDVNAGMSDIKQWLARIDQKLDAVILKDKN